MEDALNRIDKVSTRQSLESHCRWADVAAVAAILIGATGGCDQPLPAGASPKADISAHRAADSTPQAQRLNLQDSPGASLGKYRMYWPKRGQTEVAERIAKVATVLRQRKVNPAFASAIGRDFAKPLDDNRLEASYDDRYDTIRVRDEGLVKRFEKGPVDIGERKAQLAVKEVFSDLVAARLIDARHYDLGSIRPSHHYLRMGSDNGEPTQEMVVEYRFRMLRKLNGIEVPNNGILIGIGPSGQRSSIKIGGVQIESVFMGTEEQPVGPEPIVVRKVASADIEKRFEKEVLAGREKRVAWHRLMYVMPEGTNDAVVEPTMVYRFSEASVGPDGQTSLAPTKLYSFSLSNDTLPPAALYSR